MKKELQGTTHNCDTSWSIKLEHKFKQSVSKESPVQWPGVSGFRYPAGQVKFWGEFKL